jgi:hypothetical protein
MGSKWIVPAGTLPAALLCAVSFAQEQPKPPAAYPAIQATDAQTTTPAPKAPAPAARSATPPANANLPALKRTLPAKPGAGAPHTNVETTAGLEKRAAASSKPKAVTASPALAPPK